MTRLKRIGSCCALALLALVSVAQGGESQSRRERLANGATVIVRPVDGIDQVAVIAAYSTGFVDEPADMTQAAHLAEHLRCFGGEPGSFEKLNSIGRANAETLPTFTYFDFTGPADQLGEALRVEAARLRMTAPPRELILQEAPRCYAETDAVERNPMGGMVKHAFMVLNQAWQHGRRRGLVRGGLENFTSEQMHAYISANFTPAQLTLVIVGGVNSDGALAAAREVLGDIKLAAPQSAKTVWSRAARETTITWDARPRAICVAYEPPDDADSRVVLTLFGNLLYGKLAQGSLSKEWGSAIFVSNQSWPVGRLPFFIYGAPSAQAQLAEARNALEAGIDTSIAELVPVAAPQIRMMLEQMVLEQPLTKATIDRMAKALPRNAAQSPPGNAVNMIIGNAALQMTMREMLFDHDVDGVAGRLRKLSADDIRAVLTKSFVAERRFITVIDAEK
ncbi:MAG: insulinase family protein [Phycisphaerales bacterium]|nr:insulinase family protein [Phycisphaerales bacterium]